MNADDLADPAVELVERWLRRASHFETAESAKTMDQLEGIVTDSDGVNFVMQFVDRVVRPDDNGVGADQLSSVVADQRLPQFLSPVDKVLLRAGAILGPYLPRVVLPLARRRMRSIVGHLVAPAEPAKLAAHLAHSREEGFALNVNLLGEAVLGEREATRRLDELIALVEQPDIDYVSVKISAVASQLNHFAHDDSLRRVVEKLRLLVQTAAAASSPTFINFDMEEYHDLELTLRAFMLVLSEPDLVSVDAGIVLQAYLPDAFAALQELVEWANDRHNSGGGQVKVRLVKGANLAMERVDAAIHGWEQAPYASKGEADANYKRCLDWLLTTERMAGVRLGLASHNLFDVAWTYLLAVERGVTDRVQFEMLQGMAPAEALAVRETTETASANPMLLYTPAVAEADFDVAISYLFRRLEETASDDNFLRHLFDLAPGSDAFARQEQIFRLGLEQRNTVGATPRRTQNRLGSQSAAYVIGEPFLNEPETDPTLTANHDWIRSVMSMPPTTVATLPLKQEHELTATFDRARIAQAEWAQTSGQTRQAVLHRVGDELAARRAELISTMVHEANKTFAEADGEVAEAIDFARFYGDRAVDLRQIDAQFTPLGVVAVVPPWNFPVAIPTGGVTSSMAAGNAVVLKPAPETQRCAEIVAEACWAAGVPEALVQFTPVPENEVGRHLITTADAVILTGASETAELFRSWKPDLRLFAETSGKNALIITPNADIDLAVADLAKSAFGHSGQKCSAASLAILVGDVYSSARFRRQLVDAVESLDVGLSTSIETSMGPLIGEPNERLIRGLATLDDGETWLVEPSKRTFVDEISLWSPGVRDGVTQGSWFHTTECFGPVLGLMFASDLDEAIAIQNSSNFGLTGGIHTLDPVEIEQWTDEVEVGNGYVNRPITGAIVQRQPFGGWKQSSVGPGAKAGGPNYVAQLGTWASDLGQPDDFADAWEQHFVVEHDPTALFCEANVFRYRPKTAVVFRTQQNADPRAVELIRRAIEVSGVRAIESHWASESEAAFSARLPLMAAETVRVIGDPLGDKARAAANHEHMHIADEPASPVGRIELLHYVDEQAISTTLHRFGNLVR